MTVQGRVVDYADESSWDSPTGGSSEMSRIVNVHVTGTNSQEEAEREGKWVAGQDAEGDLLSGPSLVGVQGPPDLDPGTWLVSCRITYLRFW